MTGLKVAKREETTRISKVYYVDSLIENFNFESGKTKYFVYEMSREHAEHLQRLSAQIKEAVEKFDNAHPRPKELSDEKEYRQWEAKYREGYKKEVTPLHKQYNEFRAMVTKGNEPKSFITVGKQYALNDIVEMNKVKLEN
jgi:hypothetical protein